MTDNVITPDEPVNPVTPDHDEEGHKAQIRAALKAAIEGAAFVAKFTATDVDDKAVAIIGKALENDLVIHIIHLVWCGLTPEEAVKAASEMVDAR